MRDRVYIQAKYLISNYKLRMLRASTTGHSGGEATYQLSEKVHRCILGKGITIPTYLFHVLKQQQQNSRWSFT